MREETFLERLRKRFIWGKWSWRTLGFYHGHILVVGKLKIVFPERRRG